MSGRAPVAEPPLPFAATAPCEPCEPPPPEAGRLFLQGGQIVASADGAAVVTILGSCVAVCLFDPRAGVGGMNHYLLPIAAEQDRSPRYGTIACAQLLEEVLRRGARRADLRAKVFGGAGILAIRSDDPRTLGDKNVETALAFLGAEGIPVVHGNVGGTRGRKLVFRTNDGAAWVRTL